MAAADLVAPKLMLRFSLRKKLLTSWGRADLQVEMEIGNSEWVSLCGESGSGKTTTLRMLAGLSRPDAGVIEFDGTLWYHSERKIFLPPQQRRVGFLFQDYALFPNLTVRENVEFGLERGARSASGAGDSRVKILLDTMGLRPFEHRHPALLSGGQKQRIALARALAANPRLLLLDEPLSALDPDMRVRLQDELIKIRTESGIPGLMVTHDRFEAQRLGHRTLVLRAGAGDENESLESENGATPRTFLPYPLYAIENATEKDVPDKKL
jgi:molybdate transport system ATP-binding protein